MTETPPDVPPAPDAPSGEPTPEQQAVSDLPLGGSGHDGEDHNVNDDVGDDVAATGDLPLGATGEPEAEPEG